MSHGIAASSICSPGSVKHPVLSTVKDIDIDKNGKFKYILIKVHDPSASTREFKHIVRGYQRANYHADIFDEVSPEIEGKGMDCECVGGGRIEHDPNKQKLHIYGYSQGFGRADHEITYSLLGRKYKNYNITFANEGY